MAQAKPCPCGHSFCKDWHVEPQAAVQGVGFTKLEAEAVAFLLNETDENNLYKVTEYHLEEIEGCFQEYKDMPCASLLDRLEGSIRRAKLATNRVKENKDG